MASPLPDISALTYALPAAPGGTAQITVLLDDVPGPSVKAGVFEGTVPTGTPLAQGDNGGTATIVIPIDPGLLDPSSTYIVALTLSNSPNWGAPAILVFQQPVLTAIEIVGDGVTVRWTVPDTSNILAVAASIYDTVTQKTLVSVTTGSLTVTLYPPQPVDPVGNYVVRLIGQNGVASGPLLQSTESLILTSPAIASTTYDTGSITIQAAGSTPPHDIYAQLIASDVVVAEVRAADTTATFALDAPLDAASVWSVALLYRSTIAAGPLGVSVVIPLVAPELAAATFDGSAFTIAWTLPANATGASVTIDEKGGGNAGRADVQYGTSTTIAATVDANKSYEVRLAPYNGTARGLFGAATPLIVAAPAMGTATSDGSQATVTMSGLGAPATETTLQLTSAASVVATSSAGLTGGSIAVPTGLAGPLAVTAFASGPKVTGPVSTAPITLVTNAPVVTGVSISGNNATVAYTFSGTASSYQVNLVNGLTETTLGTPGASPATVALPATVAAGSGIVVRAVSGNATGPASAIVPLLTGALTVNAPQYDGSTLFVDWSSATDADVIGYTVAVVDGSSTTIATLNTLATNAAIDIALPASADYTINVNAYGAGTTGPVASVTFSVPPATTLTFVTYSEGSLFVDWTALTAGSVTGYRVDVFLDYALALSATVDDATSSQVQLPASFAPGAEVTVTVTPLSSGIDGPTSPPIAAMTVYTTLTNVFYDGTTLDAQWATQGGAAPTYVLAVKQGTTIVKSQAFTTDSGSFAVDLSGTGYTVVVWSSGASTYGPVSAPVDPQSGAIGYFFSTDTGSAPYVFRSASRPPLSSALTAADVIIYVPNVFTGSSPSATNPQGTFSLTSVTAGPMAYRINVKASVVWSFTAPSRATLRADFVSFLQWLETVPVQPGAIAFVARALSLAMPLTFSETLLYRYGFNPTSRYVDLVPGMKMRVDPESYQFTANGDNDGFITQGSATYDLSGATNGNLAWDAFLSQLVGVTIDSTDGGMGGAIDLYAGVVRPYYRLIYPSAFPATSSEGSADPTSNVAILGAKTFKILNDATGKFLNGQSLPADSSVSFFRGRAVVLPRIVVTIDGSAVEVSVGTTLRQLIGSWANLPFFESLQLTGITVERSTAGVVDSIDPIPASLSIAQRNTIDFSNQTMPQYSNGTDWFDLPLLGGDRIRIDGGLS